MERKAGWIPDLAPQFGEELENRNWEKIAIYSTPANIAVVKEFYTNARQLGDSHTEDYMSYVRGKSIRYDPDSINKFLHVEWTSEQCQFVLNMIEGADYDDMERVLTMNNKAPLGHPSLITHLCKLAGVNTSSPPLERPRKAIDEAYYKQYCGEGEVAQPIPPRHPSRRRGPSQAHAPPHDAEPFQMRDMYMSLMEDRLQSIHRGQVATTEMIIGMYDTPPGKRWTMDEFNNVVAWPEEQAQGNGVGAAEAPAMEEDDDDDFEDAEEEGEEEDSD
ncbi:hypothetical protein LR48_Vigan02g102100 [Vigna angularis]|uniref:Putative plant transposon protein domain-containing protein n=1 Tax=Phaseolus angularis TaxID=3914 RepID=A0A0L9TWJ1_PHAAN|nr:hypothetical protein LR48_Vigan02g102100 [Vigna angularis]